MGLSVLRYSGFVIRYFPRFPMKLFRLLAVVLLLAGCVAPTTTPGGGAQRKDLGGEPVPAVTVWTVLADRIDDQKVLDTDELCLIVKELREAEDISAEQVRAFDRLGLAATNKPAKDPALLARLRGLP
jgi:hypothetical protein